MEAPINLSSSGCSSINAQKRFFSFCSSGEDVDKVGGAEADNNFMTLSDSRTCGKMTALAKLLDLWYQQESANKVRSVAPSYLLIDWLTRNTDVGSLNPNRHGSWPCY